jgi:hypothetical protein
MNNFQVSFMWGNKCRNFVIQYSIFLISKVYFVSLILVMSLMMVK